MGLADALTDFMPDQCIIRDPGSLELDRATGANVRAAGSIWYEGRCNIQDRPSNVEGRDGSSVVDEHEIRLPPGVEGLAVGQIVEVFGAETTTWEILRLTTRSLGLTTRVLVRRRTGRRVPS